MSYQRELEQYTAEVHKRVPKRFPTRRVYCNDKNEIWAIDLNFMIKLEKFNKGFKYILVVEDIYTRKAWAFPLKDKKPEGVINCLQSLIKKAGTPKNLWNDKGGELVNKEMNKFLEKHNIQQYSVYGESKASMVESLNQSLKKIMYKILTEKQSFAWYDILDEVVNIYNNKRHSVIKMTPEEAWEHPERVKEVMEANEIEDLTKRLQQVSSEPTFALGDFVRVSKKKTLFEKGYDEGWSPEVFRVVGINHTLPPTYQLNDLQGERIEGSFYAQEMQKTMIPDFALIEKVLDKRNRGKKKEVLVKYVGYPNKFNEWIDAKQVKDLYENN